MKDLFGNTIPEDSDDFKDYLKKFDNETLNERAVRLKYLTKIKSDGYLMMEKLEEDAKLAISIMIHFIQKGFD